MARSSANPIFRQAVGSPRGLRGCNRALPRMGNPEPRTSYPESRTPNPESRIPPQLSLLGLLLCAGLFLNIAALSAREFPPEVPPPKPIVLPTPQVRELPNGLQVVVIERHSLPLVTLRLVVKSGAEADPPTLPGTAQLTAGLLSQGTARRSARDIAEAVDFIGGSLDRRGVGQFVCLPYSSRRAHRACFRPAFGRDPPSRLCARRS